MSKRISYIIPCYRSERTLEHVVNEILQTMQDALSAYTYEIILVNDCSPDGTYDVIRRLAAEHPHITGIDMTRNFGQHSALMAGFHFATGDIVICLDDDGQTPPAEAVKLVSKIEEGYDVVYARYGKKEHSGFRNLGSRFNSLMAEEMLGKPHELYISSFFAAQHFIVEEMMHYKNPYPYVIGLVLRSTNRICNVDVHHQARESGSSGYSFRKLVNLWMNGFTSFSVKPLRMATYAGVITAIAGFLMLIYVLMVKLSGNPDTPMGWASMMAVQLVIGGMILLVLGMVGEYVGRMYISMNNAPQYVIRSVVTHEEETGEHGAIPDMRE